MARASRPLWRSRLERAGLALLAAGLLLYPLDWAVWRVRSIFGAGMGSAEISQTTAATLKGTRFEIYQQQTLLVSCSRSLLPEAGASPCWWLHRHPEIVTQY